MYASDISKRKRDLMTAYYFKNQTNNFMLSTKLDNDTLLNVKEGSINLYYNGVLAPGLQSETSSTTANSSMPCIPYSVQDATMLVLESLLTYNASINLPPTKCSRTYYLFFLTLASGYNWVQSSSSISGTKDTWDWTVHYPIASAADQLVWMNHLYVYVMPTFVPGYDSSTLLERERNYFNWSVEKQTAEVARVQNEGHWSAWQTAWSAWWSYRASDGSVAAAAIPSDSVLPNHSTSLNVGTSQDFTDATAYPNPTQWTPLLIGGVRKNYLTYTWESVVSTVLSGTEETNLKASGQAYFPDGTNGKQTRAQEIADLVALTNALNDLEKVTAEFWAGGPFTVAPPGMFVWFWKNFFQYTSHSDSTMFYSGLELSIHLFEISRLVWGLKKDNMEARPIQDIRRLYNGQTLTKYDGTPIAGELWVPYQTATFVTPPFADFSSGHSGFSQCFANVMTKWFGSSIPSTGPKLITDMSLLSKIFTGTSQNLPFGSYTIPAGVSEIQHNIVPAVPITLSWNNWQDMADSAGISRQYGGIHCQSAHVASQAVANNLLEHITADWNITV